MIAIYERHRADLGQITVFADGEIRVTVAAHPRLRLFLAGAKILGVWLMGPAIIAAAFMLVYACGGFYR